MLNKNWKQNRKRGEQLGRMYWADTDDKVRFTYNGKVREGFIDYIWKWAPFFSRCFMTIVYKRQVWKMSKIRATKVLA